MAEHSIHHTFLFENRRHVVTCFDVATKPLTLKFLTESVQPNGDMTEMFSFQAMFPDWPYGIAFTETDNLISHQFQMIEQAVRENRLAKQA